MTLSLNTVVTGEIAGRPDLYTPSCGYGAGPDALFRITAPQAGTLTVTLDQVVGDASADLALLALDDCGAPSGVSELGCSSVYEPAEVSTLDVKKNETVFFVVDGLLHESGAYELSATLQ